jgi:hypothetical protein
MMTIRVINFEGRDEVYVGVLKITYVGEYVHIYCTGIQYRELIEDIQFMQVWEK